MKVLLLNPEFPDTYWSFQHALPLSSVGVWIPGVVFTVIVPATQRSSQGASPLRL